MKVSEFLTHVNYALRGLDDDAPTVGTEEANYWVETLNRKKNELYEDVNVLFDETWEIKSLGSITATTDPSFNCDSTLIAPSDWLYAVDSNSKKVYYDIIKPRQRPKNGRAFYIAGMNPQVVYCTNEIQSSEDIVSGTLYLPGYYMPTDADKTDGDDTLPIPDPYWGVMATAAEVAFNDITYEDKAEGLNAKANDLYMKMVRKNRRSPYGQAKRAPTTVYKIRGTEVR